MFIKYFTSPTFNNRGFAEMLQLQANVMAVAVEDGVILDKSGFESVPAALMAHWAFINREDILSPLHTRPAEAWEIDLLQYSSRYQLTAVYEGQWTPILEHNSKYVLKDQAGLISQASALAIIDMRTGEIVYEVGL